MKLTLHIETTKLDKAAIARTTIIGPTEVEIKIDPSQLEPSVDALRDTIIGQLDAALGMIAMVSGHLTLADFTDLPKDGEGTVSLEQIAAVEFKKRKQ